MNCPKCLGHMATVAFRDIYVDHCPQCGGLFFDVTELERLLGMHGAESIDTSSVPVNDELDQTAQIYCPRCLQRGMRVRMVTLVDADQPDVRFERCPDCAGSWLDAGEFNQLKNHAMAEFIKGLQSEAQDARQKQSRI